MRAEFERLANRQPFEPVSMRRYELPAPVAARSTDPAAWAESVKNAAAQCETQRLRLQNLELLLKHGFKFSTSFIGTLQLNSIEIYSLIFDRFVAIIEKPTFNMTCILKHFRCQFSTCF